MDKAIKPFNQLCTVKRSVANRPADDITAQTEDDNAVWIIYMTQWHYPPAQVYAHMFTHVPLNQCAKEHEAVYAKRAIRTVLNHVIRFCIVKLVD